MADTPITAESKDYDFTLDVDEVKKEEDKDLLAQGEAEVEVESTQAHTLLTTLVPCASPADAYDYYEGLATPPSQHTAGEPRIMSCLDAFDELDEAGYRFHPIIRPFSRTGQLSSSSFASTATSSSSVWYSTTTQRNTLPTQTLRPSPWHNPTVTRCMDAGACCP